MTIHSFNSKSITLGQFEQYHNDRVRNWLIRNHQCSIDVARLLNTRIFSSLRERFQTKKIEQENVIWEAVYKIADSELLKLQSQMDKNFGLSEPQFNEMVEACRQGDETIYEKIFLHHFSSCMEYLKRNYSASEEDAYDASMETLIAFLKKLKLGKITYGNLRFLFTRMASQIYLKWIKKENRKDSIEGLDLIEEKEEIDEEDLQILDKAWNELTEDCQVLLKAFYYDKTPLNKIAESENKTPASVRKQKQRCIEKLRKLFAKHT